MKKELISQLHNSFESITQQEEKTEFWYARDLQKLLGYLEWRNFLLVIDKAKMACKHSKHAVLDHFVDVNKMIALGKGGQREVSDIKLTRYACYLIAQNGDPQKSEIAFAHEHVKNNKSVRNLLKKENITPEHLPAAEDIKKLNRKIKSEEKRIEK